MPPTVVNIRNSPHQVYIGRGRRGQPTKWGNPFPVGSKLSTRVHAAFRDHPVTRLYRPGDKIDRAAAITLYRALLEVRLQSGKLTPADFIELDGKTLGCFCKPQDCHGDVIRECTIWFVANPTSTQPPHYDWNQAANAALPLFS